MNHPRRLISFDWAMKRLLRSKAHFGILEGFLSELLREEIRILEILESETNQDTGADKQNRVDLRARNAGGEIILIEVQYQRQFDYLQRILHSTARTLVEHLGEGRPYGEVAKVISVSILYFDLGQGEDYVYHKEQLDVLKLPEAERRAYERYQDNLHQQASMVESTYGWGMHKGLIQGREEGREEGQREERLRIARGLLDLIADDRLIAERTGLTPEQVAALRGDES